MQDMHKVNYSKGMVYFRMEADVNMSGIDWQALNVSEPYDRLVHFDGNGHVIKGLKSQGNYASLFGVLCGVCKNLGIVDADMLMSRGAKSVRAAITHPVLSGPAYERINESALEEVIVTDTIPLNPNKDLHKFTVLSVADLFADVIERVHNYKEISSIFSK